MAHFENRQLSLAWINSRHPFALREDEGHGG